MEELLKLLKDYGTRHNLTFPCINIYADGSGSVTHSVREEYTNIINDVKLFDFNSIIRLKLKLKR